MMGNEFQLVITIQLIAKRNSKDIKKTEHSFGEKTKEADTNIVKTKDFVFL